ncbi:MAG: hypothetical protein AAB583_00525 [Patescibacteria group bacterium]
MKTLSEQTKENTIEKIIAIAERLLHGEIKDDLEIAKKCIEIDDLRYKAELTDSINDEIFDIFGMNGIQDIFDDHGIPLREDVRQRWNQGALKKLDLELKEIVEFYRKDILEACKAILKKYGE